MAALGFDVVAHRIAAYTFASVIAAFAGVLLVWYQRQVSPGTAGVGPVVDILIIAVVGGLSRPIGPFVGALVYVLLRTFSLDLLTAAGLDGKRYQLVVGAGFLAIVLFSPDGLVGIWRRLRERHRRRSEERAGQMRIGGGQP
jgi:branched-chain amino acid transport system permease protein